MIASRTITHDGMSWAVAPSGFVTQYLGDEFGLVYTRLGSDAADVRFSRYSPSGTRSREAAFASLSDATLLRLFLMSQPSARAPEGGYRS
jgi:hypothetical protein